MLSLQFNTRYSFEYQELFLELCLNCVSKRKNCSDFFLVYVLVEKPNKNQKRTWTTMRDQ